MGVCRSNGDGDVTDLVSISASMTLLPAIDSGSSLCTLRAMDGVACAFPVLGELAACPKIRQDLDLQYALTTKPDIDK